MEEIRWISLKNEGGFVARIRVKGGKDSYNQGKDIRKGESKSVDLADAVGIINDGDEVWLEAFVVAGKNNKAKERFIYRKESNNVACYTISGTTLSNKMSLKKMDEKFPVTAPDPINAYRLSNKGNFVTRIRVHVKHADLSIESYNHNKDICLKDDRSLNLANAGIVREGDLVYLEAYVAGGKNKSAKESFVYKANANRKANYSINGTTLDNRLIFDGFESTESSSGMVGDIRWLTLKNNGGFVARIRIHAIHADGTSNSYNVKKDITLGFSRKLDLSDTNGVVREGDTVWLEVYVKWGKNRKASERFVYKKDSKFNASYSIKGGTLDSKLSFDGTSIEYIEENTEVRYISLKNKGAFVSRIRIKGVHPNGSSYSYNLNKDICVYQEKTLDLSNTDGVVKDGDSVQLEAYVSCGNNNKASEKFIYRESSASVASYVIKGTTWNNSLYLASFNCYANYFESQQTYSLYNQSPKKACTNYSNDVQGICHDDEAWYISHGAGTDSFNRNHGTIHKVFLNQSLSKDVSASEVQQANCTIYNHGILESHRFYKYYDNLNRVVGVKVGDIHIGDIDYFNGYIFAPIYQNGTDGSADAQILIFSTETFDLVWKEILYKKENVPFQGLAWCAVNPNDGCLYTSDGRINNEFSGRNSPLMAFKINFENLQNQKGPVFTNVTPNGIPLQMPDGSPFLLKAGMQGGCFDPYDNIYLVSGFEDHKANDGIVAFKLKRNVESVVSEYIRTRAYFIWKEKQCPNQCEADCKKDWLEAQWQIQDAMNSGMLRFEEPAKYAEAYLRKNKDNVLESAIDFSFDGSSTVHPEEPEGITYWDLRKSSNKDAAEYSKSTLHALKLINSGLSDDYSLYNYNITNLDTEEIVIDYNPNTLSVKHNPVSNRWTVVSDGYVPVKDFSSSFFAEKGLFVLKQFSQLVIVGDTNSVNNPMELSLALLRNPVTSTFRHNSDDFTFDYDEINVLGINLGTTECENDQSIQQNSDDCVFWKVNMTKKSQGDSFAPAFYSERDAWTVCDMGKNYTRFCILSDNSEKQKLVWFEK